MHKQTDQLSRKSLYFQILSMYTPLAKLMAQQARNLFIHVNNKSASIKTKDVPMKSSKLLCFNLILFYSKSCKLKTLPAVISRVFIFVMNGRSLKALGVKCSHL